MNREGHESVGRRLVELPHLPQRLRPPVHHILPSNDISQRFTGMNQSIDANRMICHLVIDVRI